jgi:hypothetical protein
MSSVQCFLARHTVALFTLSFAPFVFPSIAHRLHSAAHNGYGDCCAHLSSDHCLMLVYRISGIMIHPGPGELTGSGCAVPVSQCGGSLSGAGSVRLRSNIGSAVTAAALFENRSRALNHSKPLESPGPLQIKL